MTTQTDIQKNGFQTAWLDSLGFDAVLIVGVFVLAVVSGVIVSIKPDLFVPVMLADVWLLGYHHVISTFTKLAGTQEDRKQNWFLIYLLPLIVLLAVSILTFVAGKFNVVEATLKSHSVPPGIWAVVTIYLFWQWFHYTRQSWGIAAFYKRKAGMKPPKNIHLDQAVFWAIPVWGILNRCAQGWNEFLFLPVWMPSIPMELANAVGVFAIISLGYWAYQRFQNYREGNLSIGLTLFELSHFAVFYIGYIALAEINHGWLVANIWHNAQYILFVWLYNTNRFKHVDKGEVGIMAWLSQKTPMHALLYFTLCLAATTFFYKNMQIILSHVSNGEIALFMTLNVVIFQTVNFHHYIVDSIIWKARNKKNQKVMKVS